ncbi:hypothetical protein GJ744_006430 [Endocarpon pusillum]|uniref:DUF1479 domain protein n=1 Tax=Endocarpon pusillum TaxID=364733 RepID=A0A8H7DYC5_9EURO|nr:hypothetical protein GJ744_006430 [Endocarpon pusillum]
MASKKATASMLRRAASTATKSTRPAGDISSVFPSLSGEKAETLPQRFADLKLNYLNRNQDAIQQSWTRLLASLHEEVAMVKSNGSSLIPNITFGDIASKNVSKAIADEVRRRGAVVIRNVLPQDEALALKAQAREYIKANRRRVKAFPADNPAVYELYWSPAQATARSQPNVLSTQQFLQTLWHSSDPDSQISTTYPLTYADRFRIRNPGDGRFALGPHTDGGSLERWEDPEYSRVYQMIFGGHWEQYDAFDAKHRIHAKMDLYNGAGACSMFRFFQGWLSMSNTGPSEGTLKLCPMLQHATAYLLLRPFFNLRTSQLALDSSFPGSVPAACQEYNDETHPHLQLEHTMVSVPRVEPGDFVAWHCDTIHSVDKEHKGKGDSSVLYIPACPMTRPNVEFLTRQRQAAVAYSPPPDFPGAGGEGELGFEGAVDWNKLPSDGLRAMGLGSQKWHIKDNMSKGERKVVEEANRICFD